MDTLENLRKNLEGAKDIKSVVRAMKAMAASNIAQYETAVSSLGDYYHTVALGVATYFIQQKIHGIIEEQAPQKQDEKFHL